MHDPSRNVRLYGTEQPPAEPRVLRAGSLSAELEAGNLRHVRVAGIEIMRAVSFIVRDRDWGTYDPEISALAIEERDGAFDVSYAAVAREGERTFSYRARIAGRPDAVTFSAEGRSETGFETNRTGFVVLHPIVGVAGEAVRIERVDGTLEEGVFPTFVDPVQPMMELRALTHVAADSLTVTCRMEGDTYEMEDQRNWTDASYKSYVRPLARPWPYEIAPGETLAQRVTLSVEGDPPGSADESSEVTVRLGEGRSPMPGIGVGFDPAAPAPDEATLERLAALGLSHLIVHHDPRQGGGEETLRLGVDAARALGAAPWLEAVVTEVDGFARELDDLGALAAALDPPFDTVTLSPASDLKGTLPGSEWPPAPPADALYAAARAAFPNARIGGGVFAFFTELNRKRPPSDALDTVTFTTAAVVHAGDDVTVMENLEALPAVVATAREIAGKRPLSIGPSAIGMRLNPYGAAPMENPDNVRQAMNRDDPRQRGLMGAAWLVGYAARAAVDGVAALTFGTATGAHGLVHAGETENRPWFDEHGFDGHGGLYPAFHVVRALAARAGDARLESESSHPSSVACIAFETGGAREALLANLGATPVSVALPGAAAGVRVLDADAFVAAASDPAFLDTFDDVGADAARLALDAYAVARVRLA